MNTPWLNEDERLLLAFVKTHSGSEYVQLNPDGVLTILLRLSAARTALARLQNLTAATTPPLEMPAPANPD
jgi:hypothetical protein